MGFLGGAVAKNLLANAGDSRDVGSIPGSGISSGEGNGNPFQYSCLENSMDRLQSMKSQEVDMTERLTGRPCEGTSSMQSMNFTAVKTASGVCASTAGFLLQLGHIIETFSNCHFSL